MNDKRNLYARIRTLMANERTLMAYYRTSLALVGIGIFIYEFYKSLGFIILAALFGIIGIIIAIYGTGRFLVFKKKIMKK